ARARRAPAAAADAIRRAVVQIAALRSVTVVTGADGSSRGWSRACIVRIEHSPPTGTSVPVAEPGRQRTTAAGVAAATSKVAPEQSTTRRVAEATKGAFQ